MQPKVVYQRRKLNKNMTHVRLNGGKEKKNY